MKKVQTTFSVLLHALCLVFLLGLTACGSQTEPFSTEDVQTLSEQGAFTESLETLDTDTAFTLYRLDNAGLERDALQDCAVLRSAGGTCEEAAVLIFSEQDQAKQAVQALNDYLSAQIESNRNYRPLELPKLENALLEQRDTTVLLVVAGDLDLAKQALKLD